MRTLIPTLNELWAEYRLTGGDDARNAIAERHIDLVEVIANKVIQTLPSHVDVDDLVSWGIDGLLQAIKSFEPDRNVKFTSHASIRIRGAILDQIRTTARLPRLTINRVKKVDRFHEEFLQANGRRPCPEEIHEHCGRKTAREVESVNEMQSMHAVVGVTSAGEPVSADTVMEDRREVNPVTLATGRDMMEFAARTLKLSEALMLKFYFYEGWTMKRIANELIHKTESRVSQMMDETLAQLRKAA